MSIDNQRDGNVDTGAEGIDTPVPYVMNEWQAIELAVRGLVSNAIYCNKGEAGPDVSILQTAVHVLPQKLAEEHGSAHRHRLIDAIDARKPKEPWVQSALRKLLGRKAGHPAMQVEQQWLQEFGDQQSPTMLMTHADIAMKLGDREEAERLYGEALRIAREEGLSLTE